MRRRTTHGQRGAVGGRTLLAVALTTVIVAGLVAIGAVLLLGGGDDPSADPSADPGGDPSTTSTTSATEAPSDEPPTDASEDDFCEAVVAADDDIGDQIDGIVTHFDTDPVADDLAEVGTPTGADSDQRAGFLLYLEVLREIDGAPTADFDSDNPYDDLSPSDRADFDAYADYEADLCL
ncbi:hypothetical protein [Nocardioides zeae]|uniref:Uncharacterized protein n=1 Tax=Nocardioides zeae TaxID=1457234 RepID=A0AAJ1X3D9_9ACTN|nr:hypothetical protein [Nocardioides zeae]MDQ1106279.1 hypothetical protein [Nocardioides zeae]